MTVSPLGLAAPLTSAWTQVAVGVLQLVAVDGGRELGRPTGTGARRHAAVAPGEVARRGVRASTWASQSVGAETHLNVLNIIAIYASLASIGLIAWGGN